jgi:hypothetical protein
VATSPQVIIECQKHDDYQESIRWLLSHLKESMEHGRTVAQEKESEGVKVLKSDPALKQATKELRTLLERFANGNSIDTIIDAVNALVDDAQRDKEFKDWFKKVDTYIHKVRHHAYVYIRLTYLNPVQVLLQPGFVLEPACNAEGHQLRESGRHFYDVKYKGHFDNLFHSVGSWFKAMGEDPLNTRFGEDWARLTKDLLFDSEGSLKFKPDLWMDVRKVLLPTLLDKVRYSYNSSF